MLLYTYLNGLKFLNLTTSNADENVNNSYTAYENSKWYRHFENSLFFSFKSKRTLK